MAVGDKLVTLDGLKAVYQELNGNTDDLKSALNAEDACVNNKLSIINYGYNTPFERIENPSSSGWQYKVGIRRDRMVFTLNKSTNSTSNIRIKISGDVGFAANNSGIDAWNTGILLKADHRYRVTAKLISGSSYSEQEGDGLIPSIAIYKAGAHSSLGTEEKSAGLTVKEFTAEAEQYNIAFDIASNKYGFANAQILVTMEDLTESALYQVSVHETELSNLISAIPKVKIYLKSGDISNIGAVDSTNTRIRSAGGSSNPPTPTISEGDFYTVSAPYEAKVAIYDSQSMYTGSFVALVNAEWKTGKISIPKEYVGKRATVVIRKIGHENDDISADLETITNYVTYSSLANDNSSEVSAPIRVLGIGNSYTRGVMTYLSRILHSCGYENVVVGQCYQGAVTLSQQYENRTSTSFYEYYREYTVSNGVESTEDYEGVSLEDAIQRESWDYIVFQQQSDDSGQYASFYSNDFSIDDFINYVKGLVPNAQIGIVAPWTHAHGFEGQKFISYYNGSVDAQDAAIKTVIPQVAAESGKIDIIVDLNRLVESARQNAFLGDIGDEMLNEDKNHLVVGIPAYMCGILYAMCIGADIKKLTFYPPTTGTGTKNAHLAYLSKQAAKHTFNLFDAT